MSSKNNAASSRSGSIVFGRDVISVETRKSPGWDSIGVDANITNTIEKLNSDKRPLLDINMAGVSFSISISHSEDNTNYKFQGTVLGYGSEIHLDQDNATGQLTAGDGWVNDGPGFGFGVDLWGYGVGYDVSATVTDDGLVVTEEYKEFGKIYTSEGTYNLAEQPANEIINDSARESTTIKCLISGTQSQTFKKNTPTSQSIISAQNYMQNCVSIAKCIQAPQRVYPRKFGCMTCLKARISYHHLKPWMPTLPRLCQPLIRLLRPPPIPIPTMTIPPSTLSPRLRPRLRT